MTEQDNNNEAAPRLPSLDGNPNVVDVSASEIAKMIANGYRVQLVRKRNFRANDMKLRFSYPVLPRLAGQLDGNFIYVTVEVHDGLFCDFKSRPTELLDAKPLSDMIDGLYDHVEFDSFKIKSLRWFKENGMADSTSQLKGSVVYFRGTNIHLAAVASLLSGWLNRYLSPIYDKFGELARKNMVMPCVTDFIKRIEKEANNK